jgi:3-hydroxybutyryl-CoA dehydrogenase
MNSISAHLPANAAMGVVGGGTMGVGIAYVYAAAGWATFVAEPDDARAAGMAATLAQTAQAGVRRGKLDEGKARDLLDRIRRVASVTQLPQGLDLVVESVPERLELKQAVLREIDARGPGLIATNTSSMSIDALARCVSDPARFLGMHYFNPVWSLQLVELIRGERTSEETIARARRCAESLGKQTIVVRDVPGFATSRLDLIAALEAMRMVQDGVASAEDIDLAATTAYRHPMGPLRLSDVVGLDVRLDIARHLSQALGERYAPPRILEDLVARGHLGQKTGKGFFDWTSAA